MLRVRPPSSTLSTHAFVLPLLIPVAFAFKLALRNPVRQFNRAPVTCFSSSFTHAANLNRFRTKGQVFMSTASSDAEKKTADFDKDGRIQRNFTLPPIPDVPLQHHTDRYNSAIVEDVLLNSSSTTREEFKELLDESMAKWRAANIRAVWIRLATEAAELFPVAIAAGFSPHHAAPDHITLTAWFGDGPSRLPPGPSHFVGVAGFVLDRVVEADGGVVNKVLVIQEKSGPAAGIGLWKLPGGLVDPKEDIPEAAAREVWEETGIEADFQRLCTIQENHGVRGPGREGSTDLFCLCYLKPRVSGAVPTKQEAEIAECRWMDVDELAAMPMFQKGVLHRMLAVGMRVAAEDGEDRGLVREEVEMVWRNGTCSLLLPPGDTATRISE